MHSVRLRIIVAILILSSVAAGSFRAASAQNSAAPKSAANETGFASKKPVFGGACPSCPWGAMATVVQKALQPYGYDVQICHSCAGGPRAARLVAAAALPSPPPPNGPVDFGATGAQFLWWAYQGIHDYAKDPEGPRKQLRFVANLQDPTYLLVAVKADSGITDLHQIKDKRLPVHILTTNNGGLISPDILEYYGLTKEAVESWGGHLATVPSPEERKNVDVIIAFGALNNAPEYNFWYEQSQKYDLKYLPLADDLVDKLVANYDLEKVDIPEGLLRGLDHPIPGVGRTGTVIYGRTDMPDDFAYTLAKALDEHQDLLQWTNLNFSYNAHTVWKAYGVPLHPGAARYYREKGYMR